MEKKQDSLDYWLEEVQEKETYKFMYSKFLLKQMPLEVQEDEGMFAQVLNYGTKVLVSAVQHRHPETQCLRVIREAKGPVWKWKPELRDELPYAVKDYEENLAECALCVAWGILYLECRDEPRVVFLNQMLRIWKTQWSCYKPVFGGEWTDKTKLDIMHDLVKKREEDTQHKKDTRKKETTQEADKVKNGITEALETRIHELENENKQLRLENEQLKSMSQAQSKDEEIERLEAEKESFIVELLTPIFYGDSRRASEFLNAIEGLDNQGVTDVARQWSKENMICPSQKGRKLWQILHAAKRYLATEQNWTAALRK
ncbi:MAG: hypothetical protein IJR02_09610 [Bacteroidaceae bacterium]|nr:hypothetical protein [Bacteroidaceae bacterium]